MKTSVLTPVLTPGEDINSSLFFDYNEWRNQVDYILKCTFGDGLPDGFHRRLKILYNEAITPYEAAEVLQRRSSEKSTVYQPIPLLRGAAQAT
jgi:hypothetical protein